MKPFLLLGTRDHDSAAQGEYEAVLRHGGLGEENLVRIRVESGPLPWLNLDDYSGIILGGSAFTSSDSHKTPVQVRVEEDLTGLVARILDTDFPFLGLCYGVGIVSTVLGSQVDREFGEPVGAIAIEVTPEGRLDPLLRGIPDTFHAFVGHKEACNGLPPVATLLARGAKCPVQMYRVGMNVYVTQFHPELDADDLVYRMQVYQNHGYFDPDELAELTRMAYASPVAGEQHLVLSNFVQRYAR